MNKSRILLVSYTVPENTMGGAMLLYRHFIKNDSFEVGVITNREVDLPFSFNHAITEPKLIQRLSKTRLHFWVNDYINLIHAKIFNRRLESLAKEFQPDIIFNVAETYLSSHALMLARKLNVPLVAYFMDWSHFALNAHSWIFPTLDRRYRDLYKEADLALCISDGMLRELGDHSNAHVIHPIGGNLELNTPPVVNNNDKFEFCFAGNLAHWYGIMIRKLIEGIADNDPIALKVFGDHHSWEDDFVFKQRQNGTFRGFLPYEALVTEFHKSDGFILPMGFDENSALIERTSFKTKFLDYILFKKPILVWGPEYCTAVEIAKKFDCAYCVTDPDPASALKGMHEIANNPDLRKRLVKNAIRMRETEFNHQYIHNILKTQLEKLILRS